MNKFKIWEQILIFVALYSGVSGMTSMILRLLLTPLLPSVLSSLQSPNYQFSPAVLSNMVLSFIVLGVAVFLTIYFLKRVFKVTNILKFAGLSTLLLAIYTFIPTAKMLAMDNKSLKYMMQDNTNIFYITIVIEGIYFLLFFLATYYLSSQRLKN